jgi:DnaJ-class molecular chaperone
MIEPTETPCPDCRGTGQIVLLTSVQICDKCRGTGQPHPDAALRREAIENVIVFTIRRTGQCWRQRPSGRK